MPREFTERKGWVVCPHCSKSAAESRRGHVHEGCAAQARAMQFRGWGHLEDGWEQGGWARQLRALPHISDIFKVLVYTREFTHESLRQLYRQEFGRLWANVVRFNCSTGMIFAVTSRIPV